MILQYHTRLEVHIQPITCKHRLTQLSLTFSCISHSTPTEQVLPNLHHTRVLSHYLLLVGSSELYSLGQLNHARDVKRRHTGFRNLI